MDRGVNCESGLTARFGIGSSNAVVNGRNGAYYNQF
jgi:hypothetical protein